MQYVPSLDGVRGLCILAVMLSHYGFFSSGGWFGVEIFFVLSGFLITSILIESRHNPLGRYLLVFYTRRALRIFPVYFLALFVFTMIYFSRAPSLAQFGGDWTGLLSYTYNWRMALRQGRQAALLTPAPYTHFWSLCAEEQFYFAWPLIVYYLRRDRLKRLALSLVILVPAFRYALGAWLSPKVGGVAAGAVVYVLTLSHLDAFMCGALLSIGPAPQARSQHLCLLAFAALAFSGMANALILPRLSPSEGRLLGRTSLGFSPLAIATAQHVWGYTLISAFGLALIWWAVDRQPGFLCFKPLVRLGKVSYGAYIFHLPLLLLFGQETKRSAGAALLLLPVYIGAVWGLATLSFYVFEKRFLDLKDRIARAAVPHPKAFPKQSAIANPSISRT